MPTSKISHCKVPLYFFAKHSSKKLSILMATTVCKLVAGANVAPIAARRHLECRFGLPIFLACVYSYGYSTVRSSFLWLDQSHIRSAKRIHRLKKLQVILNENKNRNLPV